jgi:hypothetical protein
MATKRTFLYSDGSFLEVLIADDGIVVAERSNVSIQSVIGFRFSSSRLHGGSKFATFVDDVHGTRVSFTCTHELAAEFKKQTPRWSRANFETAAHKTLENTL